MALKHPEIGNGKKIKDILSLPCRIDELVDRKKSSDCLLSLQGRNYSVLVQGDSYLGLAFIYFSDAAKIWEIKKELERTNEKLRNYSSNLNEFLEEEKKKLACELHDTIGQNLVSIRIKLQKFRELFSFYDSTAEYQDILNLLEFSIKQVKQLSYDLKPRILDEMGLGPALNSFCHFITDETGIKGSVDIINAYRTAVNMPPRQQEQLQPLGHKLEAYLYRITQETVHNRLCNSNLSEFNIQLVDSPQNVKLFFTDNGTISKASKTIGALNELNTYSIPLDLIKEKVESLDGNMKIDFSDNNGAFIIVEIPKKAS